MFKLTSFFALSASTVSALSVRCRDDQQFDIKACQCLVPFEDRCVLRCGYNTIQDPRERCKCTDRDEVNAIYDHGFDDQCMPKMVVDYAWIDIIEMDRTCPRNMYFNEKACKCFMNYTCQTFAPCPNGGSLDPTKPCECTSAENYKKILSRPTNLKENCDEHKVVYGDQDICQLTAEDCPNSNFTINEKECKCECDKFCIATHNLNRDTCTCEPLKYEPSGEFICDADGNKQCLDSPKHISCPGDTRYQPVRFDERACMCMPVMMCKKLCPRGQTLDPREVCSCIDRSEYDSLYQCEPPKAACSLTIDDCPSPNFTVDEDECECQCDKECGKEMSLNEDTCTCEPIKLPPTEEFTCSDDGKKQCLDDPSQVVCKRGWFDEKICACNQAACRKFCPYGQQLDPREFCSCVDNEVVEELQSCAPPCTLTVDQCPNENFVVDEESCECQCDLTCDARNMSLDTKSCTCKSNYFNYYRQQPHQTQLPQYGGGYNRGSPYYYNRWQSPQQQPSSPSSSSSPYSYYQSPYQSYHSSYYRPRHQYQQQPQYQQRYPNQYYGNNNYFSR